MPVVRQIERLISELDRRGTTGVIVLNPDLYALQGADREAALDALVAGKRSPYVLLDGTLVCTGSVEVDAVLGALA